jgi:hypothetical protein
MDWLFAKFFGEVLPSNRVIDWLFETYQWLLMYRGGFSDFRRRRRLVLPTEKNFRVTAGDESGIAREVFESVKRHARMEDWWCNLEAHEDEDVPQGIEGVGNDGSAFSQHSAAGTFSMGWNHTDPTITYSPRELHDLPSLVATFAHELSHYWLASVPYAPPAGPTAEEQATDVCAVYLGFGVYMANNVKRYAGGAVVSRKGYLGEIALSYALAIFTELQGLSETHARKYLKPNPRSFYGSAIRDIRNRFSSKVESLRHIKSHDQ